MSEKLLIDSYLKHIKTMMTKNSDSTMDLVKVLNTKDVFELYKKIQKELVENKKIPQEKVKLANQYIDLIDDCRKIEVALLKEEYETLKIDLLMKPPRNGIPRRN